VTARVQSHSFKFFLVLKNSCASWSSGKLGELFNVQADVSSRVRIAAVATLTMEDAQFFRVGLRGLDTHHVFLYSP
jgi:hypothetical protein